MACFKHHIFGGATISVCAAGLAAPEVMERDNSSTNVTDVGGYLISELKKANQVKKKCAAGA